MADLEQSLEELDGVKQSFKANINNAGISTSNVEFRNMPNLINQMEKKLPEQSKVVNPTTAEQNVSADTGYKLKSVKINAVIPSDYYKPEEVANVTPTTNAQVVTPSANAVFNQVNVSAVTSDIDSNIQEENIKEGVTILGKTGTFKGGITPTGTLNITENGTFDVTNYATAEVSVASSGGDDVLVFDRVFGNNTPEQISKVAMRISYMTMTTAEIEETYGWKLGDTIDIPLTTGENLKVMIIGFSHDSLTNNGRAGITLQAVNLPFKSKLSSNVTNGGGYQSTEMHKTFLPEFETKIPQDWINVIKPVNKSCADGGGSYYTKNISVLCNLFLLSEREIMGAKTLSVSTEGNQYEYWKNHNTDVDRIKYYDSDLDGETETATTWWTRSPYKSSSSGWCYVGSAGALGWGATPIYNYGVALAFCV